MLIAVQSFLRVEQIQQHSFPVSGIDERKARSSFSFWPNAPPAGIPGSGPESLWTTPSDQSRSPAPGCARSAGPGDALRNPRSDLPRVAARKRDRAGCAGSSSSKETSRTMSRVHLSPQSCSHSARKRNFRLPSYPERTSWMSTLISKRRFGSSAAEACSRR